MFLFRYALRNLLRHRIRTALTTLAVSLAVGMVLIGATFIAGLGESVMTEFTRMTGHVRLRNAQYEKESRFEPLEYSVKGWRGLRDKLLALPGVKRVQARLSFRVLLQYTDESTIVPESAGIPEDKLTDEQIYGRQVIEFAPALGVEPESERTANNLDQKLSAGRWFSAEGAGEMLIGAELAHRLGVKPGDKLLLLSMRQGMTDALLTVAGIFDTGNKMQNRFCYVPIGAAEQLLRVPDEASELLVFGKSYRDADPLARMLLSSGLVDGLEVKKWNEIGIFRLITTIFTFIISLMLSAIIIVASVGLLNTMLMTVLERQREIGVLLAMGLSRGRVVGVFLLEALLFGVAGCLVGGLLGVAGSLYFVEHGINLGSQATRNLPFAVNQTIYGVLTAGSVVTSVGIGLVVAVLGALWPALRASSIQPIEAMRKQ